MHFKQKMNVAVVSLLTVGVSAIMTPSWAAIPDFSSNDWFKTGDVTIPALNQLILTTGTDSTVLIDDLESFLNLTPGTLDSISGLQTTFGSATRYNAKAGDSISFDWDFLKNGDDFGFFKINDQIQVLSSSSSTFSRFFDSDQSFYIGVVDVNDSIGSSQLRVTRKQQSIPVPEPTSILSILAVGGYGVFLCRRSRKKA
jgi:hypothetical protein